MKVTKVTIVPAETAADSKVIFTVEDNGEVKEINGLSGLFLGSVTDMDFYIGTMGSIPHTFNFFANELNTTDSYLSQLVYASFSAIIQGAGKAKLEELYKNFDVLLDFIAAKMEELDKPKEEPKVE